MSRLFLPVLLGVLLGLAASLRGLLRARREASLQPGIERRQLPLQHAVHRGVSALQGTA